MRRCVHSTLDLRLVVGLSLVLAVLPVSAESTVIESGDSTLYLANLSDPGVDGAWFLPAFVPGAEWSSGNFGIGYEAAGSGDLATELIQTTVPVGSYSVYTRTTFEVADPTTIFSVVFGQDYDDGTMVWLNGVEVYRSPEMRGRAPAWNASAADRESSNGAVPDYTPHRDITAGSLPLLQSGTNLLAIGIWNVNPVSDDLVLVPELILNRRLLRGPYLQQVSASRALVRWRTGDSTDSRLLFGDDPLNLNQETASPGARTEHEIELVGLTPNRRYFYAVADSGGVIAGGDADHYFDTPPAGGISKPIRIWALGDSGEGNVDGMNVRDAFLDYTNDIGGGGAAARPTDLILMLGDNAYPTGDLEAYQHNLFEIFGESMRQTAVWPTRGNHDLFDNATQSWPFFDLFTLPQQAESGGIASGSESYFSFDYANAHFIVLDSMGITDGPFAAQMLSWLEADLMDVTEDWIVAFWHHPPYSKGSHDSDDVADSAGRLIWMRENAVPLLEDYGVDLVLSGHSHSYERTYLIDGHYGDSSTFVDAMKLDPGDGAEAGDGAYVKPLRGPVPYVGAGDGAVYTVAGSSSKKAPGKAIDLGGTEPNHPAMVISALRLGSVVIDIDGARLDALFLDETGGEIDRFTLFKGGTSVAPLANFVAPTRIVSAPGSLVFSDLSQNLPSVWEWDFDNDGMADSPDRDPVFEFSDVGLFDVALQASNSAGADTELKQDYICVAGGVPQPVTELDFDGSGAFTWSAVAEATAYDSVRGNLTALVAGAIGQLDLHCLENEGQDLAATDVLVPPSGEVLFYVVGATNCAGVQGSFDSLGSVARDGALQAVCPSCATGDDDDLDAVCLEADNCPAIANPGQNDGDGDGAGDACDGCAADPDKVEPGLCGCGISDVDSDSDSTPDCLDGCATDPGKTAPGICGCGVSDVDSDDDGVPDCFDDCPADPDKVERGVCGCGTPDTDSDSDGTADCIDGCPADPEKIVAGVCGCGIPDTDGDGDSTPDCVDECPADADKIEAGQCGCGIPDDDSDGDMVADCNDGCAMDPLKSDPGVCGCGIPDTDTDLDLTPDCIDGCENDPLKVDPGQCGCGVADTDTDMDGTANCIDGCPLDETKIDPGVCGCGIPDTDSDLDGVLDCVDECPLDDSKIVAGQCGCGNDACWIQAISGTSQNLEDVEFTPGGQTVFIAGKSGVILRSINAGRSWQVQSSGTSVDLEQMHFPVDDNTGFVVGDVGRILRTDDGGQNWIPQISGVTVKLRGIYVFPGLMKAVAVGDDGLVLQTVDGGQNWTTRTTNTTETLQAVDFPGAGSVGYGAGRAGALLKTIDGGSNWFSLGSPTPLNYETLQFPVDTLTGYALAVDGLLFKTATGGLMWSPQDLNTLQTLRGISFPLDNETGYVVGSGGLVRKTINGGIDWVAESAGVSGTLRDVDFHALDIGLIVGSNGVIRRWVVD